MYAASSGTVNQTVTATTRGSLVIRYRLYSPGTFEHPYTTNFNEYSVLPVCCAWQAEGAIYKVFNAPAASLWRGHGGAVLPALVLAPPDKGPE